MPSALLFILLCAFIASKSANKTTNLLQPSIHLSKDIIEDGNVPNDEDMLNMGDTSILETNLTRNDSLSLNYHHNDTISNSSNHVYGPISAFNFSDIPHIIKSGVKNLSESISRGFNSLKNSSNDFSMQKYDNENKSVESIISSSELQNSTVQDDFNVIDHMNTSEIDRNASLKFNNSDLIDSYNLIKNSTVDNNNNEQENYTDYSPLFENLNKTTASPTEDDNTSPTFIISTPNYNVSIENNSTVKPPLSSTNNPIENSTEYTDNMDEMIDKTSNYTITSDPTYDSEDDTYTLTNNNTATPYFDDIIMSTNFTDISVPPNCNETINCSREDLSDYPITEPSKLTIIILIPLAFCIISIMTVSFGVNSIRVRSRRRRILRKSYNGNNYEFLEPQDTLQV